MIQAATPPGGHQQEKQQNYTKTVYGIYPPPQWAPLPGPSPPSTTLGRPWLQQGWLVQEQELIQLKQHQGQNQLVQEPQGSFSHRLRDRRSTGTGVVIGAELGPIGDVNAVQGTDVGDGTNAVTVGAVGAVLGAGVGLGCSRDRHQSWKLLGRPALFSVLSPEPAGRQHQP